VLDSSLRAILGEIENVLTALTNSEQTLLDRVRFTELELHAEAQALPTQALWARAAPNKSVGADILLRQLARDLERAGSKNTQTAWELPVSQPVKRRTHTLQKTLDSQPVPTPAPPPPGLRASPPTPTIPSKDSNGGSLTPARRDYDFFAELDSKLARLSEQTAQSTLD
jgi:hypothetical protein